MSAPFWVELEVAFCDASSADVFQNVTLKCDD